MGGAFFDFFPRFLSIFFFSLPSLSFSCHHIIGYFILFYSTVCETTVCLIELSYCWETTGYLSGVFCRISTIYFSIS